MDIALALALPPAYLSLSLSHRRLSSLLPLSLPLTHCLSVSLFLVILLPANRTRDDIVRWRDTNMLSLFSGEIIFLAHASSSSSQQLTSLWSLCLSFISKLEIKIDVQWIGDIAKGIMENNGKWCDICCHLSAVRSNTIIYYLSSPTPTLFLQAFSIDGTAAHQQGWRRRWHGTWWSMTTMTTLLTTTITTTTILLSQ